MHDGHFVLGMDNVATPEVHSGNLTAPPSALPAGCFLRFFFGGLFTEGSMKDCPEFSRPNGVMSNMTP